jgi:hypothetical protein
MIICRIRRKADWDKFTDYYESVTSTPRARKGNEENGGELVGKVLRVRCILQARARLSSPPSNYHFCHRNTPSSTGLGPTLPVADPE